MRRLLRIGKRKFTHVQECSSVVAAQEAMLKGAPCSAAAATRDVAAASARGEGWNKMAVGAPAVRVEERLRIKIGEAKNLPPKSHGSERGREAYCAISLDQEEIYRTSTSDKSLSPYFGEEYNFEVPRKFRFLSLYVYDRDRLNLQDKKDKILGKVAIKKEELPKYHGKDHWFPLVPVDADSEVQGKIHIEVRCERVQIKGKIFPTQRLTVKVIECNDLTIISGQCDPYATVTLCCNQHKETKRTKARKKTICPQFDDVFTFELLNKTQPLDIYDVVQEESGFELHMVVWHDNSGVFGNVFLGEVKINLQDLNLKKDHNAWYFLQPRDNAKSPKTDLGSLRLKIDYTSDHVFSSCFYDPLRNLILKSPKVEPVTSSAAYILGEIVSNKLDAAQPLVRVFLHHGQIVPFLKSLSQWEMSNVSDTNTIFRGNTLTSKCMDEFMKLTGSHYLRETLKNTLDQIFNDRKPCEIDPTKIREGENLETNMHNLRDYIDRILKAITNSALACPPIMCQVFSEIRELACIYFPDNKEVRYSVVSGFIFLRFFAPAILGPKLFDLCSENPDIQTHRTLTLISKTVQSLGNLVSSKSPQQIFREEYMVSMYKDFITENHVEAVRKFLEIISSSSLVPHMPYCCPVILKEGVMIKRAQGRKKFGIKNFKRRYFCLTTQEFHYARQKGDEHLCNISIDNILAVEKLQEESFKMKNMFQVIQPERALYIQANNCVEEKEWIDILTKVCKSNKNRLEKYHPGAFINGHWLCCKSTNEVITGCSPVSAGVSPDIKVNIDSDREIERIHSLFLENMTKLECLSSGCASQAVYMGERDQQMSEFVIEDTQTLFQTLQSIKTCIFSLEQEHEQHLRNTYRQTRYGSEQAPIGDDNYLMMAAQNAHFDGDTNFQHVTSSRRSR